MRRSAVDPSVPAPAQKVAAGPAPTFSVVIPAYQAASTIGQAIESVLAQTRRPHQVIVCDDGSTDDLHGAVEPYLDRIVLVRRENGGGAAALNTAIGHATGDFVAGLDADDAYLPGRIEAVAELAATRPDLDILATNMYFERDGKIVGHMYERREFPLEDQRRAILDWCFLFHPAVRRSRLVEIGGFDTDLRIAYDWDCWLRLILSGSRAGLVEEPLTRYRLVSGSLSDDRPRSLSERVTVLRKASRIPGSAPTSASSPSTGSRMPAGGRCSPRRAAPFAVGRRGRGGRRSQSSSGPGWRRRPVSRQRWPRRRRAPQCRLSSGASTTRKSGSRAVSRERPARALPAGRS